MGELAALATQRRSQAADARIHIQLAQVEGHLSLVASVRQFNGHLQRLLREDATDEEVFSDVKRRTVNYLEEYVEGVERPQRRLVHAIERIETLGLATVFDRALAGANLAPSASGDPGPAWLAERQRRWQGRRRSASIAHDFRTIVRKLTCVSTLRMFAAASGGWTLPAGCVTARAARPAPPRHRPRAGRHAIRW